MAVHNPTKGSWIMYQVTPRVLEIVRILHGQAAADRLAARA